MATTEKIPKKRKAASERHPLSIAFGSYLKELRKAQDKSQAELAYDAGLDRTYISLLERGMSAPSLLVLDTLAKSFKLSMTQLVAGLDEHLPKPLRRKADPIKRRSNEASLALSAERPHGSRRSPLR
ncbi:helix-turn-helix domain-containing protein [Rhodoferax sp. WC2427]|uniref:helix-turn-helix domain-containing protein n=1 Tax=Rhodoferax sp. WC2427 TaxID=3234144 RepID=UPI0034661906